MKTLVGLSLALLFAAPVHAAPASVVGKSGDAIRSLERGVKLAGGSKTNKTLMVNGNKLGLELRADGGEHGMIGVNKTWSQHGYFLGSNGKLSANDRKALAAELENDPAMTREHVVMQLRAGTTNRHAYEAKLKTVDPKIDGLLAQAKLAPNKEVSFFSGRRTQLGYAPRSGGGGMLVINEGMSERAIFLEGDAKNGYSMSERDRADVARILLSK